MFPDDEKESNPTSFKFLQIAHAWKQAQKQRGDVDPTSMAIDDDSDDDSSKADDDDENGSSADEST